MSHQDRKSQQQIVVNHHVLREVIAWILPPSLFVGMHVRQGSTWKPRMLAATALFWATSDRPTLGEQFDHARKVIRKIFHWQSAPGKTCEGFLKMLRRWNGELLVAFCGRGWSRNCPLSVRLPDSRYLQAMAVAWKRLARNQTNRRIPRGENKNATPRS